MNDVPSNRGKQVIRQHKIGSAHAGVKHELMRKVIAWNVRMVSRVVRTVPMRFRRDDILSMRMRNRVQGKPNQEHHPKSKRDNGSQPTHRCELIPLRAVLTATATMDVKSKRLLKARNEHLWLHTARRLQA